MSFSNQEYLYQHLPSRYRREDKDLFLKRFLQFFGDTLDDYDDAFDSFFENINSDTASETWIKFWLENLFGWSWFPKWFTLAEKRQLYGNFAGHLARRGTANGIKQWLLDFTIVARVYNRPAFYGESVWGENVFTTSEPLLIAVEILYIEPRGQSEMSAIGDAAYGESVFSNTAPLFTNSELQALLRYVQPHAQEILLIRQTPTPKEPPLSGYIILNSTTRRALDKDFAQLTDLLNFEATVARDLSARTVLTGYVQNNFTPLRTLDGATAQLEDAINFINTVVADYIAGNPFANYNLSNFIKLRTINPNAGELENAVYVAMTIAADLDADA